MSLTYGGSVGDTISYTTGSYTNYWYKLDTLTSTEAHWELYDPVEPTGSSSGTAHGFRIIYNTTTNKNELLVNGSDNSGNPAYATVNGAGTATSGTIEIALGDTVWLGSSSGFSVPNNAFTVIADHLWSTGSGSGSGRQQLSGGTDPEIINVEFTRISELQVEMEFEHQNVNSVTVRKLLADNTLTSATQNLAASPTTLTFTLSYGDTWWIEHPDFLDLPRYKLERVKWSYNPVSYNLTGTGWWPDNGGNNFGANYDVALFSSNGPDTYGTGLVDRAFASTSSSGERTIGTTVLGNTMYYVVNPDGTSFGSSFTTHPLSTSTKVFHNFW